MRRDGRTLLLALLAAAALVGAAPAGAQPAAPELTAETPYPLRGEPVEIRLTSEGRPLPGVTLRALYRPNSETAHTEELGITGADGTLTWTPRDAGVVTLQAAGADAEAPPVASAQVAVRFGSFPPLGLAVMTFAALLLFGGAGLGFWLLMRPPGHPPTAEPPST